MPETTTIDLLRHGECQGGDIFRGTVDVALSETGWQQMHRATVGETDWQCILTSPLQRCRVFAETLAEARGLPLTVEDRLREMDFGAWEGQLIERIWREQPDTVGEWLADPQSCPPPGGEALDSVQERAYAALEDCVKRVRGGHCLLVTHGGIMRVLLARMLDMPPTAMNRLDLPWACFSRFTLSHTGDGDWPRLLGHNMHAENARRAPE